MRKTIYSLLLVCSFYMNVFSQEYSFDNFYEYNTDNGTKFFMTNSSNENYLFFGYTGSETIYGYIIDFNTNEFHNYDVNNNLDNSVNFSYTHSRKTKACSCDKDEKNISYSYGTESIDSLMTKITINKIKTKKNGKTKFIGKVELSYKNNEKYIFHPSHLKFYSHHFFNSDEVITIENKLPVKIVYNYNNGYTYTSNLAKRKKINTLLSLSKEQIKYTE